VQRFEAAPVTGTSTATLNADTRAVTWTAPPQPATIAFAWPPAAATLAPV
jgi:hypothetical protein